MGYEGAKKVEAISRHNFNFRAFSEEIKNPRASKISRVVKDAKEAEKQWYSIKLKRIISNLKKKQEDSSKLHRSRSEQALDEERFKNHESLYAFQTGFKSMSALRGEHEKHFAQEYGKRLEHLDDV
jgi:hypothetical protein